MFLRTNRIAAYNRKFFCKVRAHQLKKTKKDLSGLANCGIIGVASRMKTLTVCSCTRFISRRAWAQYEDLQYFQTCHYGGSKPMN